MEWLKKNWFKLIIAIFLLICTISISYYFVYFLPKSNQNKFDLEREKQERELQIKEDEQRLREQDQMNAVLEKQKKEDDLQQCLDQALDNYAVNWNSHCTRYSSEVLEKNNKAIKNKQECLTWSFGSEEYCSKLYSTEEVPLSIGCKQLPSAYAEKVEGWYDEAKDECYKRYNK